MVNLAVAAAWGFRMSRDRRNPTACEAHMQDEFYDSYHPNHRSID